MTRKYKRIERVKKYETVVCQMADETIQSLYDKTEDLREEANRATEEAAENPTNAEIRKKCYLMRNDAKRANMKLWEAIHEKYNLWLNDNVGIRDGYAIVTWEEKDEQSEKKDFIRRMIKDLGLTPPPEERS